MMLKGQGHYLVSFVCYQIITRFRNKHGDQGLIFLSNFLFLSEGIDPFRSKRVGISPIVSDERESLPCQYITHLVEDCDVRDCLHTEHVLKALNCGLVRGRNRKPWHCG
ncbi:hypothetical protein MLD38_003226 [Melastoma candidum]|uniref:Uncharacterized protein n=1 Tax=Melastoma candidum TaxID=119954 RepID=A0ACB9S159_9MYRT|nr:hypothetical protein MLD38_003226 [Melastoma candidum]